jgi:hypothetical protein
MTPRLEHREAEGRPANRTAFRKRAGTAARPDQALRRRRVYQTDAAPAATISVPSEIIAPIGAPVTGRALPALTPPPGVVWAGPGLALLGDTELGPTPGGTVSVLAVGVEELGAGVAGVVGVVLGLTLP